MRYVYLIKNTQTGCTVGVFDSLKKAKEVFSSLEEKMNHIIYKFELNRTYETNI